MIGKNVQGCRIARVRMKTGADIRIMHTRIQDTRFLRTLVLVLDKARKGDVRSFAMVFRVENADGSMSWIEAADVLPDEDGGDINMLLGGIERMKARLIAQHPDKELQCP